MRPGYRTASDSSSLRSSMFPLNLSLQCTMIGHEPGVVLGSTRHVQLTRPLPSARFGMATLAGVPPTPYWTRSRHWVSGAVRTVSRASCPRLTGDVSATRVSGSCRGVASAVGGAGIATAIPRARHNVLRANPPGARALTATASRTTSGHPSTSGLVLRPPDTASF